MPNHDILTEGIARKLESLYIIRRSTGELVAAEIRPSTFEDALLWARGWVPHFPADAEDSSWDWVALMDLSQAMPERFACSSLLAAGELQGLRMLEVSEDEVAEYGTHALRLSTAPWNRPPEQRFRGAGSLLVASGLFRSLTDGHRGRMHCSSLPQAEAFHQRNGMALFDDLDEEGLRRYRFDDAAARDYLARLRQEGLLE
jgi:hypothetical protein